MKSLMFTDEKGKRVATWNPMIGCDFYCSFCWARRLAEKYRRQGKKNYEDGFQPRFIEERLKSIPKAEVVFPVSMGDWMSPSFSDEQILRVIRAMRLRPETTFMTFTKNPSRLLDFLGVIPRNVILGATILTDDDELFMRYSKAPPPSMSLMAMRQIRFIKKAISIEPILKFSETFLFWIKNALRDQPAGYKPIIYVGMDNYPSLNKLEEPPKEKVLWLISNLKDMGFDVRVKTIRRAWWEK